MTMMLYLSSQQLSRVVLTPDVSTRASRLHQGFGQEIEDGKEGHIVISSYDYFETSPSVASLTAVAAANFGTGQPSLLNEGIQQIISDGCVHADHRAIIG